MSNSEEQPIYIDTRAMLANKAGLEAVGIAMDLLTIVWWPTKAPFAFDAKALAAQLSELLPARGYSDDVILRNLSGLRTFFTELPDGRWAPSPQFFSLSNGNPGSAS
jgi:hypothetical protein